MRCPSCGGVDDRVVDSREVEQGGAIRRRRECASCGFRFTTFERLGGSTLLVTKRSGQRELFDRDKVAAGVRAACKNRPVDRAAVDGLVDAVEDAVRRSGPEITSQQVGVAVLDRLRELDEVAYLRFASVYKGFEDAGDFAREAGLLTKQTAPKRHGARWAIVVRWAEPARRPTPPPRPREGHGRAARAERGPAGAGARGLRAP